MIYIYFYACGKSPFHKLSNFAIIDDGIIYDGLKYCSTEHAFQAQKYQKSDRFRFSVNGDLGNIDNLDNMFRLVFGDKWESKKKFWMKKSNVGIVAKMATNPTIGKKLGLKRDDNFKSTDELWLSVLSLKYEIPMFKELLISTENAYLVEFDRAAKHRLSKWGGIVDENGVMFGDNLMGKYLMTIRDKIISDVSSSEC